MLVASLARAFLVVIAAFLAIFVTIGARAQTPAPSSSTSGSAAPSSSGLIPPRLVTNANVDYPAGASGDAVVVLSLSIAADGTVTNAASTEGDEPFAAAAVGAAFTWKFEPARRDGKPIPSKIRFKVTFIAPVTVPAVPSTSASASAAPAASGSAVPAPKASTSVPTTLPEAPIELVVQGEKLAPAVTSMSRVEIRELPGAFGDPFRAIESMPGVTPIVSGLPFFYIRGAPPGNVGYFLDGVRVPYLYHIGLGPSVIHPGMVDRVDLYPGGYPARFGRYAGGLVAGETAEPRIDPHGEYNVRLVDLGALVETGFDNGRGTVLLGGRYSYTALLFSLIAKDVSLDYRDYQARVTYDLTPRDRITIFSFGSYDLLGQIKNEQLNVVFGSEFYRLDMRYDHKFGPNSSIRYAMTLGWDQTKVSDQRNARDRMVAGRIELRHALSQKVLLRAGTDITLDSFQSKIADYADPDNPNTQKLDVLFPPRSDYAGGIWGDLVWKFDPRVEITPGVRIDYFKSAGATATGVDPRLAMRFHVSDAVRIVHAYGIVHQPPSFIVPVPGLVPGSLNTGLQRAFQTSAGVETDLFASTTATATVFHSAFFNMTDAIGSGGNPSDALTDKRSRGESYGFELFVRKRMTDRLGGFLSYTLSRSLRTLDGITFPATFDRRHVGNVALAYDLGRHWRAGARFTFYTGAPKVISTRGLIAPPPSLSPERDPPFYRLDVRLEKKWLLGERAWISFVMEMMNATLHKETFGGEEIGPVAIPSIGMEGAL